MAKEYFHNYSEDKKIDFFIRGFSQYRHNQQRISDLRGKLFNNHDALIRMVACQVNEENGVR
jgi:hypothetical protein